MPGNLPAVAVYYLCNAGGIVYRAGKGASGIDDLPVQAPVGIIILPFANGILAFIAAGRFIMVIFRVVQKNAVVHIVCIPSLHLDLAADIIVAHIALPSPQRVAPA